MKKLSEMKRELDLTPVQVMLLANTGSMTTLLEALFGTVAVKTELQKIAEADSQVARILEISKGDDVNHRIVRLTSKKRVLVYAESFAPVSLLNPEFKDEIMKSDIPIGRIIDAHRIESRRVILGYDWQAAGTLYAETFSTPVDSIVLKRNYNIIHNKKPLINILEVFPYEMAK